MKKRYIGYAVLLLLVIVGTTSKYLDQSPQIGEERERQREASSPTFKDTPKAIKSLDQDTSALSEEDRFTLYAEHIRYLSRDTGLQPGDFVTEHGSYRQALPNHKEIIPFLTEVLDSGDLALATRLIDEIPDEFLHYQILSKFSQEIAKQLSPDQAIELLSQIDIQDRTGAMVAFFTVKDLVDTEPRKAADWTLQLPSKYSGQALSKVCAAWRRQNKDSGYEAFKYLSTLSEDVDIDKPLNTLASSPRYDPELFNTITEAIRNPSIKSFRCALMAEYLYKQENYQDSLEWMLRARDGDAKYKAQFDKTLADWKQKHPDAAATFIEKHSINQKEHE